MLKKKVFSVILAVVLASCLMLMASPALAQGIDYMDYITDIKTVDGVSYVTFMLPLESIHYAVYYDNQLRRTGIGSNVSFPCRDEGKVKLLYYFNEEGRIDTSDLPAIISVAANLLVTTTPDTETPLLEFHVREQPGAKVIGSKYVRALLSEEQSITIPEVKVPRNSSIDFAIYYTGWLNKVEQELTREVSLKSYTITMSIDSLFMQQQQSQKTNKLLEAVEKKLADNGKKLDDVLSAQGQTNQKLDGIQDTLDSQMQNEIDKAEEMGTTASDQVAEAIPDKSAELLPAMQNLAASLSYQGTEAKLPFPKVSMPAIPGVCTSFELIPAQEIDFASFVEMVPSSIINVLRAVCDICIVLWAFKELYGIYQYVISLKGGGSDV